MSGKSEKPTSVAPSVTGEGMWRLQWDDGTLSADHYNLSRANDILRNYDDYIDAMEKSARMMGHEAYRKGSTRKEVVG